MTALAHRAPAEEHPPATRRLRPSWEPLCHAAVMTALVWWALPLTHAAGGKNAWSVTLATVSAAVAVLAVRPWRTLSPRSLVLAAAIAVGPVVVCLIDTPGWFGAAQAAAYGYSALLFTAVRGYATTPSRRVAVVAVVLAGGVAQVAWALLAWVGGGDPGVLMVGTFYWYNQFAAFLLAPAIIGAGVVAVGRGSLRLAAAVTTLLCSAGVVLSTSRASIALLIIGWLLGGVVAVAVHEGLRSRLLAVVRWAAAATAAVAFTATLPGPPLFSHRVSALHATSARNAAQSVGQNGGYRLQFWKQASQVFRHHPVTGAGFGSFGRQAGQIDPNGPHSALVHSGFLQALSDGGLLLGLPLLVACTAVGLGLCRCLVSRSTRADHGLVPLVALAGLIAVAHSAVDFDWTYPSLMAQAAVLAGIALSLTGPRLPKVKSRGAGAAAVVVLVSLSLVMAVAARGGGWQLTAPQALGSAPTTIPAR